MLILFYLFIFYLGIFCDLHIAYCVMFYVIAFTVCVRRAVIIDILLLLLLYFTYKHSARLILV